MTLRLATFNLENLGAKHGRPAQPARLDLLRLQLARLRADVLCLQEVNAREDRAADGRRVRTLAPLDELLAGTPYAGFHRAVTRNRAGDALRDVHNLAILSRWPIVESRQYWHDLVPEPLVKLVTAEPKPATPEPLAWDRPLLHAEIALPDGRRLHAIDVHFRAPLAAAVPGQKLDAFAWKSVGAWAEGFYLSAVKRAGQALEARLLIDRLLAAEPLALVAIAGDFNAEERDDAVEILRGDEENTANGALAMQVLVPAERAAPPGTRFTVVHQGRKLMLDHVLASRALMGALCHAEIHNEALEDELVGYASVAGSPESYHAPLVVEFDLASGG